MITSAIAICKQLRIPMLLVSSILPFTYGSTASSADDELKIAFPALFSACQATPHDQYFKGSPVLVIVISIGVQESDIYELNTDNEKYLATMHYDEGGLDAQGGVWSMARASDVYDYLIKRPFKFYATRGELDSSGFLKHVKSCNIDYKELKAYEAAK
jgi:hypothetical protein